MRGGRQGTAILLIAAAIVFLLIFKYIRRPTVPRANSGMAISKHASEVRIGPPAIYPNPKRTPGSVNPAVRQANIHETVCNPSWRTRFIRPSNSYTTRLKALQIVQWGLSGNAADYEEDHLISLELGGHPSDPHNLWPEPYEPKPGAREKDVVERFLHKQVCDDLVTLEEAQKAIATDWYKIYLELHVQ